MSCERESVPDWEHVLQLGLFWDWQKAAGARSGGLEVELLWFERKFRFDLPEEMFAVVLERLRGTPSRLEEKVRDLSRECLTRRDGDKWSIQEHVGHLLDLDELHDARLDDYLAGAEVLRPADVKNRKTHQANHNQQKIEDLLREFRRQRMAFVRRLEEWDRRLVGRTAMHPRLQQPMRVIDMAYFVAEHDDHHLTRMSELAKQFSGSAAGSAPRGTWFPGQSSGSATP